MLNEIKYLALLFETSNKEHNFDNAETDFCWRRKLKLEIDIFTFSEGITGIETSQLVRCILHYIIAKAPRWAPN
jgi:hypothetical protein